MFEHLKQINADVLNVGYVEMGPADGQVVVLIDAVVKVDGFAS